MVPTESFPIDLLVVHCEPDPDIVQAITDLILWCYIPQIT